MNIYHQSIWEVSKSSYTMSILETNLLSVSRYKWLNLFSLCNSHQVFLGCALNLAFSLVPTLLNLGQFES